MKFTTAIFTLVSSLISVCAIPALQARNASPSPLIPIEPSGPSIPTCWANLDCTYAEIQAMPMSTRLSFVQWMEVNPFVQLKSSDQFHAIEGVIEFFKEKNIGAPGSWVSYVDAGIVEAIQRGGAIALGLSTATGGNPGSELWAGFFRQRMAGGLTDRDSHDPVWGTAEQTSTEYAKGLADTTKGVGKPTAQELRWYQFTQLFRFILRNRTLVIWTIRAAFLITEPVLALGAEAFIDWLTDVTDVTAARVGCEIAWGLSAFDVPVGFNFIADAKFVADAFPKLWTAYQQNT